MDDIYSLYIGATKLVGIKGKIDKDNALVVETLAKVSALGFDRGIVVDIEKACAQVRDVVHKLVSEDMLHRVTFNIILSNNLINVFPCTSSIYFGDVSRAISEPDVDRVVAQTRGTATIPLTEHILLADPQEFTVNDLSGIRTPRGLDARRLAVNLLLFTAATDNIKNINKVFDRLELSINAFYPRIVTSAHSVLRPEEKRDGVVLIDVGGCATSISHFNNHILNFHEVIPMGGESISRFLSKNLNISLLEARRLKEQYGSAAILERFEDEIIPVIDIFGKTKFNINKKRLYDQIHVAAKEIIDAIGIVLKEKRKSKTQICGIVVTGGGAKLDGFLDLLQKTLGLSVRLGVARNVSGHSEALSNAAYAPQLGLLSYRLEQYAQKEQRYEGKGIVTRKAMKVKEWIQENF